MLTKTSTNMIATAVIALIQVKRFPIPSRPAAAKPIMMTRARTEVKMTPFLGAPLLLVLAKDAGRIPPRPIAKK